MALALWTKATAASPTPVPKPLGGAQAFPNSHMSCTQCSAAAAWPSPAAAQQAGPGRCGPGQAAREQAGHSPHMRDAHTEAHRRVGRSPGRAMPRTRTSGSESSSSAAMLLQGNCCAMAALTCSASRGSRVRQQACEPRGSSPCILGGLLTAPPRKGDTRRAAHSSNH